LKKKLPITYLTFFFGWVAIIGIPPFAGFFSKDEILWHAYMSPQGGIVFWIIGVLAAICTAFYMTRLMALVFWGESRVSKDVHPHESPLSMTTPLMILAVLSIVGGWVGIPHVIGAVLPGHPGNLLNEWVAPVIAQIKWPHYSALVEWSLMGISLGAAGVAAWFAYEAYVNRPEWIEKITTKVGPVHKLVEAKYHVDEIYFSKIINPLVDLSRSLWAYIDVNFIDRITVLISELVTTAGGGLRVLQNGNIQHYALYIALGLAGVFMFLAVN
jgi:NADH-quinone oxidoreductase subunit L